MNKFRLDCTIAEINDEVYKAVTPTSCFYYRDAKREDNPRAWYAYLDHVAYCVRDIIEKVYPNWDDMPDEVHDFHSSAFNYMGTDDSSDVYRDRAREINGLLIEYAGEFKARIISNSLNLKEES